MKILWGIYVIIGLVAFGISFSIEGYVFSNISNMVLLPFVFAAIFEGAKVMIIIIHRFQFESDVSRINRSFRVGVKTYQLMLFFVSIACSITLLADFLDKPNFDKILRADKSMIENNYKENGKSVNSEFEKRISNSKTLRTETSSKYKNRHQRLKTYYEPKIEKEEALRDAEFNNVINNIRKGPQWNEHNRKAEQLTEVYISELKKLQAEEDHEIKLREDAIKREYSKKINDLKIFRVTALGELENKLNNDKRTSNQMITSLISTMKNGFNITIKYNTVVIAFAMITSALLEGTIYIVFNYVLITYHDIFALKQDILIETEKIRANAKNDMDKDDIKFENLKNRVRKQTDNVRENLFHL